MKTNICHRNFRDGNFALKGFGFSFLLCVCVCVCVCVYVYYKMLQLNINSFLKTCFRNLFLELGTF